MKKPIFLFVLAFSLGGLAPAGGLTSLGAADDSGATFGESEAANFVSFFNGIYSYDATVTGYEFSGYPTTFAISQEIAPDAQITRVGLTLTVGETTTGGDISYIYGVKGEDGNAYVRSLSTSNTTYDTAVTDSDGNAVAFETAYPTFFDGLLTVSPSAFGTFVHAVVFFLSHRFHILRFPLFFQESHQSFDFIIADKRPVNPNRSLPRCHVQHVPATQQLFCPLFAQNRPAVDFGCDLE